MLLTGHFLHRCQGRAFGTLGMPHQRLSMWGQPAVITATLEQIRLQRAGQARQPAPYRSGVNSKRARRRRNFPRARDSEKDAQIVPVEHIACLFMLQKCSFDMHKYAIEGKSAKVL